MMESVNLETRSSQLIMPKNIGIEVYYVTFCKYFSKKPKVFQKNADNIHVSKKKKHKKCIVVD